MDRRLWSWLFVIGIGITPSLAPAAPVAEQLTPGVVRFFASEAAKAAAEPSVALLNPPPPTPIPLTGLDPVPVFDTVGAASRVTIPVAPGTSLYGTGLVTGPFERTGEKVSVYTFDAFAWGEQSTRLYQAHPWIMGVRADGSSFGVLFDSTWRAEIDTSNPFNAGIVFLTDGPPPPVIVINKPLPGQVVMELAHLTGKPAFQPRWATGYQQCRYQYTPQQEVIDVARGLRLREIPCDVMYIDIEYMDGFRAFTFDPVTFPNPVGLNAELHSMGFKAVWNVSPTIKLEPGNPLYEWGKDLDYFVKNPDGVTDFVGVGWSGDSVWVDFTNPAARNWFSPLYSTLTDTGADGIWVDVNEPSVFNAAPTYDMPIDAVHLADPALGGIGPHLKYRNIYGMQSARTAYQGLAQAYPDKRPFVLTRSNYLGGQRYAATWSGDNVSDEYHYGMTIPMILTLGLSGQPYSGNDIAGFAQKETPELYARWIGVGALAPFSRGHSLRDACEPWLFGGDVEYTARLAIDRRYWLLPYLDGVFFEAYASGLPVARPLFFADPTDPALRTKDDAFLLGDSIVVAATKTLAETPQVPDIGENLRRFGLPISRDLESDLDTYREDLPHLYLRPGRIVTTGPLIQHAYAQPLNDLTLIVALDESGQASGSLYEDAGEGWGIYSGDFRYSLFSASRAGDLVTVRLNGFVGNRTYIPRPMRVRILAEDGKEYRGVGIEGQDVVIDISVPQPGAAPAPLEVDGRAIPAAFGNRPPISTGVAGAGPQIPGIMGAVYARAESARLRMGLSGAAKYDNAGLVTLLDVAPGGPTHLSATLTGGPDVLAPLAGATFDAGFTPDAAVVLDTTGGGLWTFVVRFNPDGTISSSTFLGRSVAGEFGGVLRSGINPAGARVALDNGLFAGTPIPGRAARDPATIGFELDIPWTSLSLQNKPAGKIRFALLNLHRDPPQVDHVVPDAGIGPFPLGPGPNFAAMPGPQFLIVPCAGDISGDGATTVQDFQVLAVHFGQPVAVYSQGDLNGDGVVTVADFQIMAVDFGCGI